MLLVGQQGEGQVLFCFELGLSLDRVGADSYDYRLDRFKFREFITDSLRLDGSAAGHRFGKEI